MSKLMNLRLKYQPKLPAILRDDVKIEKHNLVSEDESIGKIFPNTFKQPLVRLVKGSSMENPPLKVGVVLSGGQAAGGHNVICGLFDALQKKNTESILVGFLGGPSGIVDNDTIMLDKKIIDQYRNQGGFDMIGSGRTKIENSEQLEAAEKTARELNLDGLVVIGGDDSNTNAAILAEYFKSHKCKTAIVGVPKTIDGDLKNKYIEISFGHDTACKTYSEMIGNIARDSLSAKKYYHFIKLMGRSASHIALECALQTHPDFTIISEEVAEKKQTLAQIVSDICNIVTKRSEQNKNYGIVLIPEGLLEFIPECKQLINELNILLANGNHESEHLDTFKTDQEKVFYVSSLLTKESSSCFDSIPRKIQQQLLIDRDPHGNVRVSQIDTEQLIIAAVKNELIKRKVAPKFKALGHFMGYEGRSGFPSNFDCNYCYALGNVATQLVSSSLSGYMCSIQGLNKTPEEWQAAGVPITMMMDIEQRDGVDKPVIAKALVELDQRPFKEFAAQRNQWAIDDDYQYPGPIQFYGDVAEDHLITLRLENQLEEKKLQIDLCAL